MSNPLRISALLCASAVILNETFHRRGAEERRDYAESDYDCGFGRVIPGLRRIQY